MKTTKLQEGLHGVFNKAPHQYIISDLIFGARKKLVKTRNNKKFIAVSEISLSVIGYDKKVNKFSADHNIDFVVKNAENNEIYVIVEIEREEIGRKRTETKIFECLKSIKSVQEAFIINYDVNSNITFERCTIIKNKLVCTVSTSKSEFLNLNLKTSIVSI